MPYVKPPLGGPIGRSRMRLSASSLISWERGKRDWFLKYKIALKINDKANNPFFRINKIKRVRFKE